MAGKKLFVLLAAVLILGLAACGGQNTVTPSEGAIQTAIAQTDTAEKKIENAVNATLTAVAKGGGQETPLAVTGTLTPTVAIGTAGIVTVSVSTDTWCNKGPGSIYGHEFLFYVGQTAEVIGKDEYGNYWVIKKPDNPAVTCWLWGKYATISGDPNTLPVIAAPPTPTPQPGRVIAVSIAVDGTVIDTNSPNCLYLQDFHVSITTDGPTAVIYTIDVWLDGTYMGFGMDYDMSFASAGTQSDTRNGYLQGCGHWKAAITTKQPNTMSAFTSFQTKP